MFWTDEHVKRLKIWAAKGLSAAEIGKTLNRSRNAVIGKAYRAKIKLRKYGMSCLDCGAALPNRGLRCSACAYAERLKHQRAYHRRRKSKRDAEQS